MKRIAAGCLMLGLALALTNTARADLCIHATGTVTDLIGFSSGGSLPFAVGDTYTATIKYDDSTVDSMGSDSSVGLYLGAITDFEFTIGDYSGSFVPSNDTAILVVNNSDLFATDSVTLTSTWAGDDVDGMTASSAQFAGYTRTGLVDSDDLFDTEAFEPFGIGSFGFVFEGTGGELAAVSGQATVSAPEPATWLLLTVATPVILGRRVVRRFRKNRDEAIA